MKYILLDTNIIIDMFIDRRHQVTDTVLASFIKLLDYDEIRLIVPDIVKTETYRHLDDELAIMGKQIHKVMKEIEGLYGVSTYHIQGLDIKPYKIAIGKALKLSPPFPPLHTGHAAFTAPGVPSNQLTTLHRGSTLYDLTVHIVLTNFTYFCTSESSLIPFRLCLAVSDHC